MVHSFDGFNHLIRLEKGERLSEQLETFAAETKLDGAWISGLGGVLEVTLGFYDIEAKQYHWQTFSELREMTGLQGNMALNQEGKAVFHLHGTFSGRDYQTIGGHVKDLVAGATVELFVHRAYKPVRRTHNADVGLDLLDL